MPSEIYTKIITLSSELTCLHGRYELSPRGVALLRDMAHEARLTLDPDKEVETKAVGRKPPDPSYVKIIAPDPGAEPLWRGYRQADVIAVLNRMTPNQYHFRGTTLCLANGNRSAFDLNNDETEIRRYGLRRPYEPDYRRLA